MHAYKNQGRKEVRDAIAVVTKPGWETDYSGFSCQTGCRLALIIYPQSELFYYQPAPEDFSVWRSLMQDTSAGVYGRQCAAFFLLDTDNKAREFLAKECRDKDPRRRFNASTVLAIYMRQKFDVESESNPPSWSVDLAISLMADGSLDNIDTEETRGGIAGGGGVEKDSTDILQTPMWDVCRMMAWTKEHKAVDTLIGVVKRDPKNPEAAFALGEIGDAKAIPVLLSILKSGTGGQDFDVIALGQLKCREAVPILTARLGHPRTTFSGMDNIETEKILNALRDIGDKSAIPFIKAFLAQSDNASQTADAKRVLTQLEDDDPVTGSSRSFMPMVSLPQKNPHPVVTQSLRKSLNFRMRNTAKPPS